MHVICMRDYCMHVICMCDYCMRVICMRVICMHDYCMRVICMRVICMRDYCMRVICIHHYCMCSLIRTCLYAYTRDHCRLHCWLIFGLRVCQQSHMFSIHGLHACLLLSCLFAVDHPSVAPNPNYHLLEASTNWGYALCIVCYMVLTVLLLCVSHYRWRLLTLERGASTGPLQDAWGWLGGEKGAWCSPTVWTKEWP